MSFGTAPLCALEIDGQSSRATATSARSCIYRVTVIDDVPLLVPDVAVIVTEPAFLPVTSPFEFTLATGPSLDCHVKVRPLIVFPSASMPVAVSWTVPFTLMDAEGGET